MHDPGRYGEDSCDIALTEALPSSFFACERESAVEPLKVPLLSQHNPEAPNSPNCQSRSCSCTLGPKVALFTYLDPEALE